VSSGALRVVSEGDLQTQEAVAIEADIAAQDAVDIDAVAESSLANFIRRRWDEFKRHRTSENITQAHLGALRAYDGKYSADKLRDIEKFGGSDVFARITSVKCRGATALLRDIFLGGRRPWSVVPTPVPELPEELAKTLDEVLEQEKATLTSRGTTVDPAMAQARRQQLYDAAFKAALKTAKAEAKKAETKLDDYLIEGGFYEALVEFLIDLPIFDYAVIKGPVVQNVVDLKWVDGKMQSKTFPRMHWYRVSPFDAYFTPGAVDADATEVIERIRFRRAELNALIGVPGYNDDAIRAVLAEHPGGWSEQVEEGDAERADLEGREDPVYDHGWFDSLEFHGAALGRDLLDYGMPEKKVPDPILDYYVTAWLVGRHVIKAQINPNPRKRHPYYISSYEKIPGSLYGNGLPKIIGDIQDVANASFRSLVNNMSIASGPQVAVNEDRLSASTDGDSLYPWKRWRFHTDPMANVAEKPIDFFQPKSNAQELLGVYRQMSELADEVSAIPKYMTGSEKVGGAARTASGLSMLMNNTSKVQQMVAANIDNDIFKPMLHQMYDMIMLTDAQGTFRGDENIQVRGVTMAVQKDTDRMRRLEFLQIVANPVDMQILGPTGRANILRHLAEDLGLPEEDIVPTAEELELQVKQAGAAAAGQAQGDQAPKPGSAPQQGLGQETDNQFRTQTG